MATAEQVDFLLAGYKHPTTGADLNAGKVYTYTDGTSTLNALYSDGDQGGRTDNPLVLDEFGCAEAYGDGTYKFRIYDSSDVFLEEITGLYYETHAVSDTAYGAGWNADTTNGASKNALYDIINTLAPQATPTFTGQATIPTINLTGGQIAFPSTQAPSANANTLDDYQEGTFTATITVGTGTITLKSDVNLLGYIKIGMFVFIHGLVTVDSVSSPSGDMNLAGLPFTTDSLGEDSDQYVGSLALTSLASDVSNAFIYATQNDTIAYIREGGTTGAGNDLANHFQANSNLFIQLCYRASA